MAYVNQKFYGEANCNGGLTVTLQKGDIMKLSHLYGQEFKGWYVDDKRITSRAEVEIRETEYPSGRHYKIFCVNGNTGFRNESRIFYFIHLQNEKDYERKESSSA